MLLAFLVLASIIGMAVIAAIFALVVLILVSLALADAFTLLIYKISLLWRKWARN